VLLNLCEGKVMRSKVHLQGRNFGCPRANGGVAGEKEEAVYQFQRTTRTLLPREGRGEKKEGFINDAARFLKNNVRIVLPFYRGRGKINSKY